MGFLLLKGHHGLGVSQARERIFLCLSSPNQRDHAAGTPNQNQGHEAQAVPSNHLAWGLPHVVLTHGL